MRIDADLRALVAAESVPLRAELFTIGQLGQHAARLAAWHVLAPDKPQKSDRLVPRLVETQRMFHDSYTLICEAVTRGRRLTPGAEWFVDNYPLIEEQIRTARRHLPANYSRQLPRLANLSLAGQPRVYNIAIELIAHSHGRVDLEGLGAFISAYQKTQRLRLGELWAIPIMLRLALLDNLRRLVASVVAGRLERERADHWVERMLEAAAHKPEHVVLVLAELVREDRPLSNAFAAEFASRMQGQAPALAFAMSWLEQRLAERGEGIANVFQNAGQSQAADQVAIGNSIGSLRFLGATDWRDFVEGTSVVESTLRADPVYSSMAFETRDRYRHVVEHVARRTGLAEQVVAQAAIDLAAGERHAKLDDNSPARVNERGHVGFFLIDDGLAVLESTTGATRARVSPRAAFALYGGAVLLLAAGMAAALKSQISMPLHGVALVIAVALLLMSTSQLAISIVHWFVALLAKPVLLPRLDFSKGIPKDSRTVIAVPTLIGSIDDVDRELATMEGRFLANRDPHLSFALLSDFKDAPQPNMSTDDDILRRAVDGINDLNRRYGQSRSGESSGSADGSADRSADKSKQGEARGPFYLFHRARLFNAREGCWMGWERKRGKLEEFNDAVRGHTGRFQTIVGDLAQLQGVPYVIVLDSDTDLPRDAGWKLAATMAHPLNRPVYDERAGRVTRGYSILQPRVGVTMACASASRFVQVFAGEPGIDPYTRAVSDVYQDLFQEGSFIGKGIYDVDAVRQAVKGRFPENCVLSHDLLEGAYARSGLVTDVVLIEDQPAAHATEVVRRARWVRGDWQIMPWLFRTVREADGRRVRNPLSLLSQWKILDNLRRSLLPVALMAVLLLGWSMPGAAGLATLWVAVTLILPGLLHAIAELWRRPTDLARSLHGADVARALGKQLLRDVIALAWLPYDALVNLDSSSRALVRAFVTRRQMLEWRTAGDAARLGPPGLLRTWTAMWIGPAVGTTVVVALGAVHAPALVAAAPIVALWCLGPWLSWWLSLPLEPSRPTIHAADHAFLGAVARRTWSFFEKIIAPDDNHLPPDNLQEDPPQGIAHRTSPTNIGLSLTSTLAAYDFGFIPASELIERTTRTFATMDKMPRHRGHFFNWYDTRSLTPLEPLYVSTVDSGNLAGHLLILAAGLQDLAAAPIIGTRVWNGLRAAVDVYLEEAAGHSGARAAATAIDLGPTAPQTLSGFVSLLSAAQRWGLALPRPTEELTLAADNIVGQCGAVLRDVEHLAPWLALGKEPDSTPTGADASHDPGLLVLRRSLDEIPTLAAVAQLPLSPALSPAVSPADQALCAALSVAAERATERILVLQRLAARCREFADIDYEFLYDRSRHLFSIGCHVGGAHRLDTSYYDLLASEARLASFVAIAQGKIPQEHWFSLGRSLTMAGNQPALLSWSGSMFEYLMPLLIMPTWDGSLLESTCEGAVRRQIEYGAERGVAWGVSESGYATTDAHLNYQYRAFGVPGLGFKRGLADDLVIAPYASALALMIDPAAATANLRRLVEEHRRGPLGFYEAIDHTASRVPPGKKSVTVRSYMAHHQGMVLLSLAYVLLDRPMQRRFAADPALRATELLLQERIPKGPPLYPHPAEVSLAGVAVVETAPNSRSYTTPATAQPQVHLLSNGTYHVVVTNAGGGSSRWRGYAITRWREDPTRDCWGSFVYLRDVETGDFWSAGHQPTLRRADTHETTFSRGRAELRRIDGEIESLMEIGVSPEDDVELRRVSLTNHGNTARKIELTSYAEVVLAPAAADVAHPSFSNLFVQTEWVPEHAAVLCTRRPRSGGEHPPWMVHLMAVHGTTVGPPSFETGREAFVGRGRTLADPAAMYDEQLKNGAGAVLDPVACVRNVVVVPPYETVRVDIVTGAAETRERVLSWAEKYGDRHSSDRLLELAWTQSQVVLGQIDASEADAQLYERLASSVFFTSPVLRPAASLVRRNRTGQTGLWPYGISGDLPIVLLRIGDIAAIELARQVVKAHAYWRLKGLEADLVIWNEDPSGYHQQLHDQVVALVMTPGSVIDKPGGVFLRRSDQISEEDRILLQSVARVVVTDTGGTLAQQLDRRARIDVAPVIFPSQQTRVPPADTPAPARSDLHAYNGLGGFTADGREYVMTTSRTLRTPAPWVNVIANPWFGTVVSESGAAYTWCENAHSYRLTPWSNDPISDVSGESFYLRDEESGHFWSPTPQPAPSSNPYTTRHGFGYSVFEHRSPQEIASELTTYVATDAPIKFVVVKLRNESGRRRRISLTGVFDLVLGNHRAANLPHIVTEVDPRSGGLLAHNAWNSEFAQRVAFLDVSDDVRFVAGDRLEILGRNGSPASPAFLSRRRLSGRVGACLDPCMAMQMFVDLDEGQEREVAFAFGSGRDVADARALLTRFRGVHGARTALEVVKKFWTRILGAVQVQTPDSALNFLANGWLIYQVLAARMWARSGFYQSGGAFGFRDQLQDALALVHSEPELLREQILRHAAHQFREGDVQHWWHPPLGRGVRTRISDDYLWLPYATSRYVTALGDTGILDEKIPFLEGRAVKGDEDGYYDLPTHTEETASLYQHCVRAIEHGLRFGVHGLPLMGTGDWNDGMNLVGDHGKGESVWLAFFLYDVLQRFSRIAADHGDAAFSARCRDNARTLAQSVEKEAWDGAWYRRAYFDDGTPLGSSESPECQIDALPQSWAVLTKLGDPARARQAMEAVDARLVRRDVGVIQLFDPPFDASDLRPGYIRGYVPGVRENGGQYTHAAVWTTMAFAANGDVKRAWELFDLINPIRHGDSAAAIARYKVEPYVLAADVYTNPQHAGRGGWTWYTGSAGWMYQLIVESLLGLRLVVDRLHVEPKMPASWSGFDLHYRYRETTHHIRVRHVGASGLVSRVVLDGVPQTKPWVPLVDRCV